jgi:hypothetical protein
MTSIASRTSAPWFTLSVSAPLQRRSWRAYFGLGFFLLTYPDEKLIAGPDCDTRDGDSGHAMSVKGV